MAVDRGKVADPVAVRDLVVWPDLEQSGVLTKPALISARSNAHWAVRDNGDMTHKIAVTLLAAAAAVAVPFAIAPVAGADVCGDIGGRHGAIGGCSNVGGDIADAAVLGAAVDHPYDAYPAPIGYPPPPPEGYPPLPPGYLAYPSFPGEAPCFTNIGQPYFTPPGAPCF